ncbi:MAG: pantetheine-phosphate adenylyltransferase [Cycloclasticus sp.]|jgi:pantetheine-phosphate adenylyltransferase|nr:pantetheine-phosphate adenylyltransferase [Cycloclasticus sp.]|tara:strand:+ start:1775 stop:2254 length:480 start_codon:yes stop_codon:yes gene_type:complete
MTKKAIYPGTFDPLTNGHINIIQRASELFDSVVVAVAKSSSKAPLFDLQERVVLAQQALSHYANVEVLSFEGLLVDLAEQQQSKIIVRGVRSIADFEYETQMAGMNRKLMPELETIFLTTHSDWADLSSTLVRDIARHGGQITNFVPPSVEQAILQKLI